VNRRLPELGRGLRPQSQHPDRVGREGRAQGRLCSALATENAEEDSPTDPEGDARLGEKARHDALALWSRVRCVGKDIGK
jgi:hypothetical protein